MKVSHSRAERLRQNTNGVAVNCLEASQVSLSSRLTIFAPSSPSLRRIPAIYFYFLIVLINKNAPSSHDCVSYIGQEEEKGARLC